MSTEHLEEARSGCSVFTLSSPPAAGEGTTALREARKGSFLGAVLFLDDFEHSCRKKRDTVNMTLDRMPL